MTLASTATRLATGPRIAPILDASMVARRTSRKERRAALFLAHGFLELEVEGSSGKVQALTFCTKSTNNVDIDELQARAFLSTGSGEDKLDGWYLDSGATHHMTCRRELFSDLDCNVRDSVKFGDASTVGIQGVGSIMFEGKTGERRVLHDVYYIPALRNSIIIMSLS